MKMFYDWNKEFPFGEHWVTGDSASCLFRDPKVSVAITDHKEEMALCLYFTSPYLSGTGCDEIKSQIPVMGKTALQGSGCPDEMSSKLCGTAVSVNQKVTGVLEPASLFQKSLSHRHGESQPLLICEASVKLHQVKVGSLSTKMQQHSHFFVYHSGIFKKWKNNNNNKVNIVFLFNKYLLTRFLENKNKQCLTGCSCVNLGYSFNVSGCLGLTTRAHMPGACAREIPGSWKKC